MSEIYEWEQIHFVPLEEWPLEDSPEGQQQANILTPEQTCEWLRVEAGQPGYYLMRYKGEKNDG